MPSGSQVLDRPPPTIDDGGGGGGGWAWLVTARGRIDAELIKGLLEAAGVVPVALDARDPSPGAWMFPFGDMNAPVRVYVLRAQLESARLELLETGFALPEVPEPEPPRRRGVSAWVLAIVALLILAAYVIATMHARVT